jgi:FkbM family methyltransferase
LLKIIKRFLKKQGLSVVPADGPFFRAALDRLKSREFDIKTVIDVGASDGRWTKRMIRRFPNARYLCVEAASIHELALRDLSARQPNIEYVIAAAGSEEGKIYFESSDPLGGGASYKPLQKGLMVPMTSIYVQVTRRKLPPPFLIKLDTHGFEVPILSGAVKSLPDVAALIIEMYNFPGPAPALSFYEMCAYLAERGFHCIDLYDPMYRPRDGALWQMDMVFLRATRPEFQNRAFDSK